MALRHAVLAALIHGEASGYELAKRFDVGVANFWESKPQQLYVELSRLHGEGLVGATEVVQQTRPTKRVYSLTPLGIAALAEFAAGSMRPTTLRDDLTVAVQCADVVEPTALIEHLSRRAEEARGKLERLRRTEKEILSGRTEADFVRTTKHLGPYLTCRRGIQHETDTERWCEWAVNLLRTRAEHTGSTQGASSSDGVRRCQGP
ncbi:PadR family transcriptional regulator [Streptomyces sp. NBC_01618]|uniref:PadR family transcriptional regulator n=1 Tax=Streptomyces sp. NBC_01618 TaxID=2975900 RepID=UPI00386B774B|nr:PadR family transcriptional regulator [Streptomyces sp. NBC_01618]